MMGNSCVCVDLDCDPADFYHAKIVTARVPHECYECGDEIRPGDKYERVSAKWEGDIATYKTCIVCVNVRNSLFKCGFFHGSLWEDIKNWFEEEGIDTEDDEGESWLL